MVHLWWSQLTAIANIFQVKWPCLKFENPFSCLTATHYGNLPFVPCARVVRCEFLVPHVSAYAAWSLSTSSINLKSKIGHYKRHPSPQVPPVALPSTLTSWLSSPAVWNLHLPLTYNRKHHTVSTISFCLKSRDLFMNTYRYYLPYLSLCRLFRSLIPSTLANKNICLFSFWVCESFWFYEHQTLL